MMIATTFVIILCCYLLLCIPIDLFFKSAADLGAVLGSLNIIAAELDR